MLFLSSQENNSSHSILLEPNSDIGGRPPKRGIGGPCSYTDTTHADIELF